MASILEEWREAKRTTTITFHWDQAHTGIEGNERADELAKEAARDEEELHDAMVARRVVRDALRERTIREWQCRWQEATTGAVTRVYYPRVGVEARPLSYEAAQIVTGHGNFNQFLKRIARRTDERCECRVSVGSAEHLVLGCGLHEEQRARCDTALVRLGLRWPRAAEDITAMAGEDAWWTQLEVFAKGIGRLARNTPQDQDQDQDEVTAN